MSSKYHINVTPSGYISKIAPDILPSVKEGIWLVPGSQNVLIGEDGTVESRKGQELLGQAGISGWVQWSDTWMTNTNRERAMRTIFDTFQVYYNGEWKDVKAGFGNNTKFSGASWFDKDESMDRYVFVNGTTKIRAWQGWIAEVASRVSDTSIKKTNGGTPTAKQILIPAGGTMTWGYPSGTQNQVSYNALQGNFVGETFWAAGFRAGDTINITVAAIAGTYTIASVDSQQNQILITTTFGSAGTSSTVGQGVIGTVNAYGPLAKTFAQERFHTQGNKRFVMLGVVYTYTGWENTDTLTGISPTLPATIPAGTLMFSDIIEATPSGWDYATGATPNVLDVARNQVYLGMSTNNWLWISKQTSFSDYAYTTPVRKNGEGGSARLDKNITAIWANNDDTVQVSCGVDAWYPISLVSVTSNGTAGEEVRVGTPKRGTGVGANNQKSVCNTRDGVVYLSKEPTLDFLQAVTTLNQTTIPVSDPIEVDLQRYDLTEAQVLYWRNYIWTLVPMEGILLAYDTQRKFWQPPQIVDGACMSIIEDWLVIHSKSLNESYRMFVGTNDNGLPFSQKAFYSYRTGTRTDTYVADGYFVEAKVTPATDAVVWNGLLGYKWSAGTLTGTFGSNDGVPFVETTQSPSGFGGTSLGQRPFGSFFTSDEEVEYRKVRQIFPMVKNGSEFFEMFVYFECDKLDAQFKIIAHGENMVPSGSHNSNLIKI